MTTKSLLLFAVLLGITFIVVSAQSAQYTIEQIPKDGYDKFLKELNDKKRAMVKKLNIADGYELTLDPELVKQLNDAFKEDSISSDGNRTLYHSGSFDELSQELGIQLKEIKDGYTHYFNSYTLLTPIHRTIGCVVTIEGSFVETACFFAPGLSRDYEDKNPFQGLKGIPGSKCAVGYANNDGLCALIGSFTTEKPLTKPPGIDVTDATDVTSGSSSTCFLIGFLLFVVSFYSSY